MSSKLYGRVFNEVFEALQSELGDTFWGLSLAASASSFSSLYLVFPSGRSIPVNPIFIYNLSDKSKNIIDLEAIDLEAIFQNGVIAIVTHL